MNRTGNRLLGVSALRCAAIALSVSVGPTAGAKAQAESPVLVSPTLGRPVFVEAGSSFDLVAAIPGATDPAEAALVRRHPPLRFVLAVKDGSAQCLAAGQPQALAVPQEVPDGTYDLEVRAGGAQLLGRHCVAVGRVGDALRIVHLSNMNIGDISAPRPDERLIDEINLVAPTLIVGTGDYIDVTHPDPQRGWAEFAEFVARFDAPLLLACGDHDDMSLYSQHVAPGPIGVVRVGPHRGIVLYDVPARPMNADADQLAWARAALLKQRQPGVSFIVSHDESPNLLRQLLAEGELQRALASARLAAWFGGGQRDWDGVEYRDIVAAATPLRYIRTQQSSTAARGGADGVSHYRVVDVIDGVARSLGERRDSISTSQPATGAYASGHASIGVGWLHADWDGPNDGSAAQRTLDVVNGLPVAIADAGATVILRASGTEKPWCRGAELASATRVGDVWVCRTRFDLPDFGRCSIIVGLGAPPTNHATSVSFELPPRLEFDTRWTADGVEYHVLADAPAAKIWVSNSGPADSSLAPLVRLDGSPLAYRPCDGDAPFATAHRLRLRSGERVALQVDLSAVRVRPGRRTMQVYWKGEPQWPPAWYPLEIVIRP